MSVRVSEREKAFFLIRGSKYYELNLVTDFQENCYYFEKHLKIPRRNVELHI